jgi:hypothetical protein
MRRTPPKRRLSFNELHGIIGARGSVVVKALCYAGSIPDEVNF